MFMLIFDYKYLVCLVNFYIALAILYLNVLFSSAFSFYHTFCINMLLLAKVEAYQFLPQLFLIIMILAGICCTFIILIRL